MYILRLPSTLGTEHRNCRAGVSASCGQTSARYAAHVELFSIAVTLGDLARARAGRSSTQTASRFEFPSVLLAASETGFEAGRWMPRLLMSSAEKGISD